MSTVRLAARALALLHHLTAARREISELEPMLPRDESLAFRSRVDELETAAQQLLAQFDAVAREGM